MSNNRRACYCKTNYMKSVCLRNFQEELFETGHVIVTTKVVEKSLNYFGNAHGGYLFTLCDQVAGLVAISTGDYAVTLQSNINYLKAGHLSDQLKIEGLCVHNGKTTKGWWKLSLLIRKRKSLQGLHLPCM